MELILANKNTTTQNTYKHVFEGVEICIGEKIETEVSIEDGNVLKEEIEKKYYILNFDKYFKKNYKVFKPGFIEYLQKHIISKKIIDRYVYKEDELSLEIIKNAIEEKRLFCVDYSIKIVFDIFMNPIPILMTTGTSIDERLYDLDSLMMYLESNPHPWIIDESIIVTGSTISNHDYLKFHYILPQDELKRIFQEKYYSYLDGRYNFSMSLLHGETKDYFSIKNFLIKK